MSSTPVAVRPLIPAQATTKSWLPRFAWLVLAYNVLVILWGAVVRATGSGAGCGDHWPLCNGVVIPRSPRLDTIIEFTHRAMTGGATFGILALLLWTLTATRRGHLARAFAIASTLLLLNEAFLGALLVKLGYVVNNQSLGRFIVLPIHLANTLLLLAALALTASALTRGLIRTNTSLNRGVLGLSIIGLAATILVGVSGSLAALGDTLFPSTSISSALANDLFSTNPIIRLRWIHPASSILSGAFAFWLLRRSRYQTQERTSLLGKLVLSLLAFQILLGTADVLLLAPTWMQIVHLLGADCFWITLVLLIAQLCLYRTSRPADL